MFTLTLEENQSSHTIDCEPFTHFTLNFRELPQEKISRILAILNEPPPPQRKTRSDAGRPKTPKTTTPPQPTLDIQ